MSRFRAWLNRNDGRYFQVDNRALAWPEVAGLLAMVAAVLLWLLHERLGWPALWSGVAGVLALGLLAWQGSRGEVGK